MSEWRNRTALRTVGIALAIVAVSLFVGLAFSQADDGSSHDAGSETARFSGSCLSMVEFEGRLYFGNATEFELSRGPSLGFATQPRCTPEEGEDDSGPDLPMEVEVWQITGVDDRIALAPKEAGDVYVAAGRCSGFEDQRRFERCLRIPLEFEGVEYVETRLVEPVPLGRPLGSVTRSGCCGLAKDEVSLAAIGGGSTRTAVANASDPTTVYLAIDECPIGEDEGLRRCVIGAG